MTKLTQETLRSPASVEALLLGTDETSGDTALKALAGGQLFVYQDDNTFNAILQELKKINFQLATMTDTWLDDEEVEP